MPCGQKGRVDQLCTSRTGPIAPLESHSQSIGVLGLSAMQKSWVATPVCRAVSRAIRSSSKTLEIGLCVIDVLPLPHRPDGDRCVQVLGRHDVDGVDVLFLVEHLAEVGIGPAVAAAWPCLA